MNSTLWRSLSFFFILVSVVALVLLWRCRSGNGLSGSGSPVPVQYQPEYLPANGSITIELKSFGGVKWTANSGIDIVYLCFVPGKSPFEPVTGISLKPTDLPVSLPIADDWETLAPDGHFPFRQSVGNPCSFPSAGDTTPHIIIVKPKTGVN
jgi:hypothetical protein